MYQSPFNGGADKDFFQLVFHKYVIEILLVVFFINGCNDFVYCFQMILVNISTLYLGDLLYESDSFWIFEVEIPINIVGGIHSFF